MENFYKVIQKKRYAYLFYFLSVAIPILFSLYMLSLNHRYFFFDDKISEAIPKFYDIGRILRQGHFPSLSTNLMNGSAYAMEYQYGIYNPVNILIFYILPSFKNYAWAAWFMSAVYLSLSGLGAFVLARQIGFRGMYALTLSLLLSLNYNELYWNASAWHAPLAGATWLIWGVAFLAGIVHEKRLIGNLLGLFITYGLCLTVGWPISVIALGVVSIIVLLHLFFVKKRYLLGGLVIVTGICSLLCTFFSIFPILSASEVATRSITIQNHSNFLVAPLDGLISFFDPSYCAFMNSWGGGYRLQRSPQFYAGWFLLPLLIVVDWSKAKLINSGGWIWGALAVIFMITSMGPEKFGFYRFPIRSVPYFHFFLVVFLMFSAKQCGLKITRTKIWIFCIITLLQCLHSMQSNPEMADMILYATAMVTVFSLFFLYMVYKKNNYSFFLWATSLLILILIMYKIPKGRGNDWGFPDDSLLTDSLGKQEYTLFYGTYNKNNGEQQDFYSEYRVATTALLAGDRSINGYTPIGHKGFRKILNISDHGNFRKLCAQSLFAIDPKTKLSYAEMMRIDRIIALKGKWSKDIEKHKIESFVLTDKTDRTLVFDYTQSYRYSGLVTWVSPKVVIDQGGSCEFSHTKECVIIKSTPPEGGEIIFSRLWFPGYEAYLENEKLAVTAYKMFWVTVSLPPSAHGRLMLKYTPPGNKLGIYFAVFGILIFSGMIIVIKYGMPHFPLYTFQSGIPTLRGGSSKKCKLIL